MLNPKNATSESTTATPILFTDSLKTPQVYLTIVAASKRFATLSAEVCDFGQIQPETTHEIKVKLCVNMPLNLEEVQLMPPAHPSLTWKMYPLLNSACFLITIQLKASKNWEHGCTEVYPHKAEKLLSSILTVTFPNEQTLMLPITARLVRPATVQLKTLSIGAVDKDAKPFAHDTLSVKTDFRVISIQVPESLRVPAPDDWTQSLHAYNARLQQEKQYKVSLHMENSSELLREEIKVLTTAKTTPITIPVYGLICTAKGETSPTTER